MLFQGFNHSRWQHGDPVLSAFAIADQYLTLCKVNVLNPQPNGFADPQAAAVQQLPMILVFPAIRSSTAWTSSRERTMSRHFGFFAPTNWKSVSRGISRTSL
jgi:hypothetical protein